MMNYLLCMYICTVSKIMICNSDNFCHSLLQENNLPPKLLLIIKKFPLKSRIYNHMIFNSQYNAVKMCYKENKSKRVDRICKMCNEKLKHVTV